MPAAAYSGTTMTSHHSLSAQHECHTQACMLLMEMLHVGSAVQGHPAHAVALASMALLPQHTIAA
jgi:hypothetical protein